MKNTSIFASAAMILATAAIASANPFSDVPASHWAYQSVNAMAEKGLIQGFPNGTFKGNQNVTRYQLAMMTARMIANLEGTGVKGIAKTDLQTLEKLTVEFADELALLGVKVTALEDDMQVVKEDVAGLKKDVANLKNFGGSKVKFSGDMLVRNYGIKGTVKENGDKITGKEHRTATILRLQMDAQIDENVTARARWNMVENNGMNLFDGDNKGTGTVEIAYIQIKDMFKFGGDFKFGRDWFTHGHKFVMHDYADAVSYTKRCGKFDVAANIFFDDKTATSVHNLYNINADYEHKGHKLYVGAYYQTENAVGSYSGIDYDLHAKKTVVEFGSSGRLLKKDKLSYDLGAVYSKNSVTIHNADNHKEKLDGWLGHVAVKYDSKKQLTARLAYTAAGKRYFESIGSIDNSNRWCDGEETILEDFCLMSMDNNAPTQGSFNNIKDIKLELRYTLKNHNKHSFRVAYDHLRNNKKYHVPYILETMGDAIDMTDFRDAKANFITVEYTYKLAANTRLRLGYQHCKTDIDYNDGVTRPSVKLIGNLYYTEIYARF